MEFIERLKFVFQENNIEVLEFNNEKGKITYKCLDCNTIYTYKCARNLFAKITLCKNCYNPFGRWNQTRLQKYKIDRLFPESNITLIDYKGMRTGGIIQCNKCGKQEIINNFEALFAARKGKFCNNCEKDKSKTFKHLQKELDKEYIKLLEWNGTNNKSKFQCLRCGHIFKKFVTKDFNGQICPNCFQVYNKFTFEQGQELLNKKGNNEYLLLQYKGTNDKSLIKHKNCGFCYTARLSDFEKTKGCPKCYKKYSKGEQLVAQFLDNNNYYYVRQKRFDDLSRYSFDFCVRLNNQEVLLEVQGQQHYKEVEVFDDFEKQIERDKIKKEYCLVNNIPLIEIPYWELKNVEKFLQLKFNDYLERE